MLSVTASGLAICPALPPVWSATQFRKYRKINRPFPSQFKPQGLQVGTLCRKNLSINVKRNRAALFICSAALSTKCSGASQTQTVERPTSTITVAPTQGKEKSPDLDDGGDGFPPRDDGDGGGGGGGGGGGWKGGFFFFGFLAFLGFLKDKEEEAPYEESRRRRYE